MDEKDKYINELKIRHIDFVNELANRCIDLTDDIIPKVCKRAFRRMNNWKVNIIINGEVIKWKGKDALLDGNYPNSFTFKDILSIQIQNFGYDEINPYLRDAIEDILMYEVSILPPAEQLILEYSTAGLRHDYGCDMVQLQLRIFDHFHKELNDHWTNTKKIQDYESKR